MTRLLVLWLLAERPQHGYAIRKALADGGLLFWFAVEEASIYSVLRTLVKAGHATEGAAEPGRAGRPRVLYAITPTGRRHYAALLRDALATPSLPAAAIDVALTAGGDLPDDEVVALLGARGAALRELLDGMAAHASAAPAAALVERRRALAAAELAWTEEQIRRLEEER